MAEQEENQPTNQLDEKFYERADSFINLANEAITKEEASAGQVANSLMFATSRFNAWVTAAGYQKADDLAKEKEAIIEFFTEQYKLMLSENIDSYVTNFNEYLGYSKENFKK
ncbi:MAG: Unknown protein [uncultured Sulfurovum sp.]|uniref:DUF3144 domain-containing protein n=1 Tax=uncultured Sulfurovum sp. TaxID=269237 RepID=A0A6S6U975_9BACT|nr:MAG: Unknown protein [uncultured Sulfurovum sp.]